MLPLHKIYETWSRHEKGTVPTLEDVLPIVRRYWPTSYMEGSAGLARMYCDHYTHEFIAYTWATRNRRGETSWRYLIFKEGHPL